MSKVDETSRQLYQQLLTCVGSWHSIVVVPACPEASAANVARALVDVANLVRDKHAKLFSTEGLELPGVSKVIVEMSNHVDGGGLAVVALDSVVSRQAGVPVALAADAALLVVHLGLARTEDARTTMAAIGEKKFIGAVTIEPRG